MESISAYFAANPTHLTLLTVLFVILLVYFILKKLFTVIIICLVAVFLFGGVHLIKDPAAMPGKIKKTVETFKSGGEQLLETFIDIKKDTKEMADKAKKAPKDINKMLKDAKENAGK